MAFGGTRATSPDAGGEVPSIPIPKCLARALGAYSVVFNLKTTRSYTLWAFAPFSWSCTPNTLVRVCSIHMRLDVPSRR